MWLILVVISPFNAFKQKDHFITKFMDGIFYVSYLNLIEGGESFSGKGPILKMKGNFESTSAPSPMIPSGLIARDIHTDILLKKVETSNLLVYPNPASTEVTIEINARDMKGEIQFFLFNNIGNSVIYKPLEIGLNTIDLNLIPGFYYYKIQNYSKEYEGKLVIN
jgi:hypothetical protein